jgi:hypothetical protein
MPRRCSRTACVRPAGALVALAALLAGCSDLYLDRRETVALNADDAVASNRIVQTIDPWPAAAADRSYRFDGDKMRSAASRYRTGKIIQPQGLGTTSTWKNQQPTESGGALDSDVGSASSAATKK